MLRKFGMIVSGKNRKWVLAIIGFVVFGATWKTKLRAPDPGHDTIAYHYAQWLHERENMDFQGAATSKMSFQKIVWYLDGKPSVDDRINRYYEHQNALDRLGYFNSRAFDWKGGDLQRFSRAFYEATKQTGDIDFYTMNLREGQETTVCFIAREEDMPKIKIIITTIESGKTNQW